MADIVRQFINTEAGKIKGVGDPKTFVALYITEDGGRNWKIIPTPLSFHESTEEAALGFHDYRWPLQRGKQEELY